MSLLLEGSSCVAYRDALYVFGGKDNKTGFLHNDVWSASSSAIFSLESDTVKFKKQSCSGTEPSPRCYHSAALRGLFMVIVGGFTVEDMSTEVFNDCIMYALNLHSFVWSKYYIPSNGVHPVPQPRCHATLLSAPNSLLLYGGYPLNDKAADPEEHWNVFEITADAVAKVLPSETQKPMLWGHAAVFVHSSIVVFGGAEGPECTEMNSVSIFNVEEMKWRWAEFPAAPEPRLLHTAVLDGARILVFGGFSGQFANRQLKETEHVHFNDVWAFSLNVGMWEELQLTGNRPSPRSGHCAAIMDRKMIVLGGVEGNSVDLPPEATCGILDIKNSEWIVKKLTWEFASGSPVAAFASTSAAAPDPKAFIAATGEARLFPQPNDAETPPSPARRVSPPRSPERKPLLPAAKSPPLRTLIGSPISKVPLDVIPPSTGAAAKLGNPFGIMESFNVASSEAEKADERKKQEFLRYLQASVSASKAFRHEDEQNYHDWGPPVGSVSPAAREQQLVSSGLRTTLTPSSTSPKRPEPLSFVVHGNTVKFVPPPDAVPPDELDEDEHIAFVALREDPTSRSFMVSELSAPMAASLSPSPKRALRESPSPARDAYFRRLHLNPSGA